LNHDSFIASPLPSRQSL